MYSRPCHPNQLLFHCLVTNVVHVVHFTYKYTLAVYKMYILHYKYMYLYLNNKYMFVHMYTSLYAHKYGIKLTKSQSLPNIYIYIYST